MTINCVVCEEGVDAEKSRKTFYYRRNDQEYKLYRCPKCGVEFWWPLQFYQRFYEEELPEHEVYSVGYRDIPPSAGIFFNRFAHEKGRLLDVGCGDGAFLEQAGIRGFEVWGIDLDSKCVTAAREIRKLKNVYQLTMDEFAGLHPAAIGGYDIVTFFEVLEHQATPLEFVSEVKKVLGKSGCIAGSVPNRERMFPEVHKAKELGDYPPAHFTRWSKDSLKHLLEKEGFENIDIRPYGFETVWQVADWFAANLLNNVTVFIKQIIIKDKKRAAQSFNRIIETENRVAKGIIILRMLAGTIFMPLAILMFPAFSSRGYHLFFYAKLGGKDG